jgi:hypothetical protein
VQGRPNNDRPAPGGMTGIGAVEPLPVTATAAATCPRLRIYFRSLNIINIMTSPYG